MKKLKEIEPIECFTFYGKKGNTSCYEKEKAKQIIEIIGIAKEELERIFNDC